MFSGIVEEAADVLEFTPRNGGARLVLSSSLDHSGTELGDSICIEGVCLTVVAKELSGSSTKLSFDLAEETVKRSMLGDLVSGARVNFERSLEVGARIHGHFVLGHVDSTVKLLERKTVGNSERLLWELPVEYRKFVAEKGSVTLSGISLTIGEVAEKSFAVYIIPHTGEITTLLERSVGQRVNFEVDVLARYLLNAKEVEAIQERSGVTREMLLEHGFDGGQS
jgi:riboflavin synthase